ncbi:MAG: Sulfate transporter family protein [Promethearchaeota archaeon]|nr:MAG: Sulfate transporter family protein [Candidatus Lokiarchaeota archaeon]
MSSDSESQKKQTISVSRKFSLRELGGAFGDWGTLIPFVIGYISIVGLNPFGIFLGLGLTNIILGLRFDLPLPVQPQKTIGTVAISRSWTPNLVISTGFFTGIAWSILGFSKKLGTIVKKVPTILVRGIQLGLAFILGWTAIQFFWENLFLGFISIGIILLLRKNKRIPSAIILVFIGLIILFITDQSVLQSLEFSLPKFQLYFPSLENMLIGILVAGIGQLLLTLTNVMIATISLLKDLFPERELSINANNLASNMGGMNLLIPFIGGMPLCHGSGGIAAQYAFGARNGGSMIMEGIIEIFLGLFLSDMLFSIFNSFPKAILGGMLIYTSFLLGKVVYDDFSKRKFPIILLCAIICFLVNIFVGFLVGLILFLIFKRYILSDSNNSDPKNED